MLEDEKELNIFEMSLSQSVHDFPKKKVTGTKAINGAIELNYKKRIIILRKHEERTKCMTPLQLEN